MSIPRQAIVEQYREFYPFLRTDRRYIPLLTFCIADIALSNTALIWFISQPFNHLAQANYDALTQSLWWLAAIVLVNQAFHFSSTLLSNWLGLRLVGRLRGAVMDRLTQLGFTVIQGLNKGDLLSRTSHDVDRAQELMVELPSYLVSHVATIILYCSMLFWLDAELAFIAIAISLIFLAHYKLFAGPKKRISLQFLQKNATLLTHEEETLSNLRGINSYGAEEQFNRCHQKRFADGFQWAMKARWLDTAFHSSFAMLIFFSAIFIVYMGVNHIIDEKIELGTLVGFLLYLGYMAVPVRGIAHAIYSAQDAVASSSRVHELLHMQPQLRDKVNAADISITRGEIDFHQLSFAYNPHIEVLHDVSLHIASGESVAIAGPSGSGKSTLAALLMRFYDPQSGDIFVDEQNIRDCSTASLRKNIAVVWQAPFLFSDSIRNNLLLANPDASERQLIEACESAYAWEFVQKLPAGLDTQIGAHGTQLSVGQQQRLSIAQAFLRDAPILILDEASSALDSAAEEKLLQAIQRLRQGRTTLMIGHRYSSLRLANKVIYLNGDGSIEVGTHDELMMHHAPYRDAVSWQTMLPD